MSNLKLDFPNCSPNFEIKIAIKKKLRKLEMKHLGINKKYHVTNIVEDHAHARSELYAPQIRHGEHPKRWHKVLDQRLSVYRAQFIGVEHFSTLPRWLDKAALIKDDCYNIRLPGTRLCMRETKWTTPVLKNLHEELKNLRKVEHRTCNLRVKIQKEESPPPTPETEGVDDEIEEAYQATVSVQSMLKGRAAQMLIYEGRDKCRELIMELKYSQGLLDEQKKQLNENRLKIKSKQREEDIQIDKIEKLKKSLNKLEGSIVGSLLDFLNKELKRLLDERRAHAICFLHERERTDREAAEAGRRQQELRRRREHDEMFKQVIKVHQDTVDLYLQDIVTEGMEFASEEEAEDYVRKLSEKIEQEALATIDEEPDLNEREETVADLVHHFVLPQVQKEIIRDKIKTKQRVNLKMIHTELYREIEDLPKPKIDREAQARVEYLRRLELGMEEDIMLKEIMPRRSYEYPESEYLEVPKPITYEVEEGSEPSLEYYALKRNLSEMELPTLIGGEVESEVSFVTLLVGYEHDIARLTAKIRRHLQADKGLMDEEEYEIEDLIEQLYHALSETRERCRREREEKRRKKEELKRMQKVPLPQIYEVLVEIVNKIKEKPKEITSAEKNFLLKEMDVELTELLEKVASQAEIKLEDPEDEAVRDFDRNVYHCIIRLPEDYEEPPEFDVEKQDKFFKSVRKLVKKLEKIRMPSQADHILLNQLHTLEEGVIRLYRNEEYEDFYKSEVDRMLGLVRQAIRDKTDVERTSSEEDVRQHLIFLTGKQLKSEKDTEEVVRQLVLKLKEIAEADEEEEEKEKEELKKQEEKKEAEKEEHIKREKKIEIEEPEEAEVEDKKLTIRKKKSMRFYKKSASELRAAESGVAIKKSKSRAFGEDQILWLMVELEKALDKKYLTPVKIEALEKIEEEEEEDERMKLRYSKSKTQTDTEKLLVQFSDLLEDQYICKIEDMEEEREPTSIEKLERVVKNIIYTISAGSPTGSQTSLREGALEEEQEVVEDRPQDELAEIIEDIYAPIEELKQEEISHEDSELKYAFIIEILTNLTEKLTKLNKENRLKENAAVKNLLTDLTEKLKTLQNNDLPGLIFIIQSFLR